MRYPLLFSATLALAVALTAPSVQAQDAPAPPPPGSGEPTPVAADAAIDQMAADAMDNLPYGGYPYGSVWHGGYAQPMYARPLAIVVPNVSNYQTHWAWGVSMTQMTPINPQYSAPMPAYDYTSDHHYKMRPYWPTDTRQFGVYMIRGPVE